MPKRKTVGLALGSGAFRGFAHIGVLKSLKKHNISIDYISGSSIGAWVAAYYSIFQDVDKFEKELIINSKNNRPILLDLSLTGGFISGERFRKYLEDSLRHHNFSELNVPLKIVATDLISGQPFVFDSGDVALAVRASTSVPLVFKPVKYKNKLFVDGGLSNPVPGDIVKEMGADIVISVNLYHQNEFIEKKFTMRNVVLRSTRIVMHNLSKSALKNANVIIEPDLSKYLKRRAISKYFTKDLMDEMIKIGENATDKVIPQIRELLK